MKLDNFEPFSRPHSGSVIMQLMTKLDVSNKEILEQLYQNSLECKAMGLILRLKIRCHNAHTLKIYN